MGEINDCLLSGMNGALRGVVGRFTGCVNVVLVGVNGVLAGVVVSCLV